jgi:hypothetical protein
MTKKAILISLALAACTSTPPGGIGPGTGVPNPNFSTGVVVAGDYNVTGVLSTVRVPVGSVDANAVAGVAGGDPFVRHFGHQVVVINRASGDNVTVLDDQTFQLIGQYATGDKSNPQDALVDGDTIYVAALGATGLLAIDTTAAAPKPTVIDLSSLDIDGHPNCVSVVKAGDKLFVACGILNDSDPYLAPRGVGKIAVVDPAQGKMVASFDLANKNPIGYLVQVAGLGGDLVIGTAPSFTDFSTGCLERISTGATPALHGCAVSNHDLGGLANHYDVSPDGKSLWIDSTAYDASFNLSGKVVVLDLASGKLASNAMTPSTTVAVDVAACPDGNALVIDGTIGKGGARIYTADGSELTGGANDIGMAPGFGNNTICY